MGHLQISYRRAIASYYRDTGGAEKFPTRPAGQFSYFTIGKAGQHAIFGTIRLSEPQHVGHGIAPRRFAGEPFGGAEGAVDEGVAAGGDVRQFEALTKGG